MIKRGASSGATAYLPWDRMLVGLLSPYDPVRGIRSTSEAYSFLLGRWRRRTTGLDQSSGEEQKEDLTVNHTDVYCCLMPTTR